MNLLKTLIIAIAALFFMSGCQTTGVSVKGPGASSSPPKQYQKKGPPPHAPAHGYRHKHHHGHDMEFDSQLGAYVVLNIPETWFGNDLYIRMSTDGRWMVSTTLEGGWRVALGNEVPPKLVQHKYKYKGKSKGKGKAKGKYKKENKKHYSDD